MSVLSEGVVSPPSSSPPDTSSTRKRAVEDENASVAPKPKKRLLGRDLGAELAEIDQNAVSNTQSKPEPPIVQDTASKTTVHSESLPTPPAEPTFNLTSATLESEYDYTLSTNGKRVYLASRAALDRISYERLIALRSKDAEAGRPQKDFYGINIHELIAESERAEATPKPEPAPLRQVQSIEGGKGKRRAHQMWTEKYRARKFTDLCGDERTHRQVLRWLKSWDPVVFPGAARLKPKSKDGAVAQEEHHRKILLLTGPPGLGKTTLAHVCAKQAGYECVEVNASDERSSSVVKNKIRDCLGTENVRGVSVKTEGSGAANRRPGKPVCVILDEVDGVAGNTGSSDGGFMKALVDLVMLDQRNSKTEGSGEYTRNKKKGDRFRMLRPLILVCNDVYASSLRPLRAAGVAEIVHVRKPPLERVIERVQSIFDKEGVPCDKDAARRLCEHTWGVSSRRETKTSRSTADGDMRSVLVSAEWIAAKFRASLATSGRLTKQWVETHIVRNSTDDGSKGLGRGGAREVAERVFLENAGFVKKARVDARPQFINPGSRQASTDASRFESIRMLRECIDTTDEHDRVMNEVFSTYPTYTFQDDMILTKPNSAYGWLDFYDQISSKIYSGSEWELKPYQSTPTLGFHYLFGNSTKSVAKAQDGKVEQGDETAVETAPFSGPRASFEAYEFQRETRATLSNLHAAEDFNIHLKRIFHSPEHLAVDLLPQLIRILTPEVKPVVVSGAGERIASVRRESERDMVRRSVSAMSATGVIFEKCRIEDPRAGSGGFVYRMEPALDVIGTFESLSGESSISSTRYAIRQIMEQEHRKFVAEEQANARQARWKSGGHEDESDAKEQSKESKDPTATINIEKAKVKKDFFGRVIKPSALPEPSEAARPSSRQTSGKIKIWATFNEGYSNAVRKPISLKELLEDL